MSPGPALAAPSRAPSTPATPDTGRPLLLCADDFGLSSGIDHAIAGLVRTGRLGAFSCLSNGPVWRGDAALAVALRGQAQLGLHFNLTEGRPLSESLARVWPRLPSLPRLLAQAHLRALPITAIADELVAQWRAFEQATGAPPDFIDGHQHVHHLPGVRGSMLRWLQAQPQPTPVRSTGRLGKPSFGIKRWVIEHSGGRDLAGALARPGGPHRLPSNALLLGMYDFKADYRPLMQAWLAQVPAEGALLFCHPGAASAQGDAGLLDPIADARVRELAYLASDGFSADLAAAGVSLAPAWR